VKVIIRSGLMERLIVESLDGGKGICLKKSLIRKTR